MKKPEITKKVNPKKIAAPIKMVNDVVHETIIAEGSTAVISPALYDAFTKVKSVFSEEAAAIRTITEILMLTRLERVVTQNSQIMQQNTRLIGQNSAALTLQSQTNEKLDRVIVILESLAYTQNRANAKIDAEMLCWKYYSIRARINRKINDLKSRVR